MRRFNLTGLVCPWLAPVQNCKIVGFSDDSATSPSEQPQAALIHNTGWVSPRLIPGSQQSLSHFFQICSIIAYAIQPAFCKQDPRGGH
jgi:hypothetical protein